MFSILPAVPFRTVFLGYLPRTTVLINSSVDTDNQGLSMESEAETVGGLLKSIPLSLFSN